MSDVSRGGDAPHTPPIFRPPPPPRGTRPRPAPLPHPLPAFPDADAPDAERSSGVRRESYEKLPTLPTDVTAPLVDPSAAMNTAAAADVQTEAEPEPMPEAERAGLAGFGLALSIVSLVASLFVGWALPLAIVAIVVSIVALRRPVEPRGVGVWALVLGVVAFVYSAGWLLWTAFRMGLLG